MGQSHGPSEYGKGSRSRLCDGETYRRNYEAIFRKTSPAAPAQPSPGRTKKDAPATSVKLTKDQVQELAEFLMGTCRDVSDGIRACGFGDNIDEDDANIRVERDHEMFLCECGWWCEEGEQDSEGVCEDCHVDETCDDCDMDPCECGDD